MNWLWYTLIASFFFGIQSFLYKTSSQKKCDKYIVILSFMITVELLALSFFLLQGLTLTKIGLTAILGTLMAIFFFLKNIGMFKALEYLPTHSALPVTQSAKVLVVILALFIFKETLEPLQIIGIIIVFLALHLIHRQSKKHENYHENKKGYIYAVLAIIPAALMEVINKFAATLVDLNAYIISTYFFSVIIAYITHKTTTKNHHPNLNTSIKLGILIGILNYIGYKSLLTALQTGPLSLVTPILASSLIVTVILARIIHKEELNAKQFGLVILSIAGVIMISL